MGTRKAAGKPNFRAIKPRSSPGSDKPKPNPGKSYSPQEIALIAKDYIEELGQEGACSKAIEFLETAAEAKKVVEAIEEIKKPGEKLEFKIALKEITGCGEYEYAREQYRDFLADTLGIIIAEEKAFEFMGIRQGGTPVAGEEELDYEPIIKRTLADQRKAGIGNLQVEVLREGFAVWKGWKTRKKAGKTK